ncbi:MAG: PQQ-binding-like beta-propeller repeat protein, partial [Thermoplasmatota archaeon]
MAQGSMSIGGKRIMDRSLVLLLIGLFITGAAVFAVVVDRDPINARGSDLGKWSCFRGGREHTGCIEIDTSGNNGKLIMSFGTSGRLYSSPVIGPDGSVYFGSLDGNLYSVRPNGILEWSFGTEGGIYSTPAVDAEGRVFFGSMDGYLYAIDGNGSLDWKFRTG